MKSKNKVLHIISGLGIGGAERQLIELLKQNPTHAVCSLTSDGFFSNEIKNKNIRLWELGLGSIYQYPATLLKVKKIIGNYEPDVIHAWMYHSCLTVGIVALFLKNKIPILWGIRCSNMNTKNYSFQLKTTIRACKLLSKRSQHIVYNSDSGMTFHNNIGYDNNSKSVIFNGIDTKRFSPNKKTRKSLRNKYNFKDRDIVLINVARVDPMKDHETLLNAFKKVYNKDSRIKLILVGKDTDKLDLPKGVISIGIYYDIEKIYNIGDAIVSSSKFGEGFSNVLGEAMSSCLFPISTNVGDAKNIIGNTGIIISPNNISQLEESILILIGFSKKDLSFKQIAARKRISENFNLDRMTKAYSNLYKTI